MRPQPDLPPRPSRGPGRRRSSGGGGGGSRSGGFGGGGRGGGSHFAGRGRALVGIVLVVAFFLLVSLRGTAAFYTDFLWFQSLGLTSVWRKVLTTKGVLTLVGSVGFFVLCWGNLLISERLAPPLRPSAGDDDLIERYHEIIGDRAWMVRAAVSVFLAAVVGLGLGANWNEWILFSNRVDFGQRDATFHTDIGFYVFQLPFLSTVAGWLFSSLVLVLFVTLLAHVVNGGIRFHTQLDRVTPQVKAHISVLLGLLALVQTGRYWLDRYQLTFSTRGTVDGATYTDVNIEMKSIYLLMLISLFAFGLFIANIWRRGWVLPGMAVGLWMLVAILAGGVVPAFVQRFRVQPAESSMEKPYIRQNIKATRTAYGLSDVDSKGFDFKGDLAAKDLRADPDTVRNIRLWDVSVMKEAYARQQQIKGFYDISNVDVDRYQVGGNTTQVLVGARNLRASAIPKSSWEATHLAFTHGYGVVVARANSKTSRGGPSLLAQDIPVRSAAGLPTSSRDGLYFGEDAAGYVIVNTDRAEIDYQGRDNKTKLTTYRGADGIRIGSGLNGTVRKAAFALRFGDLNPLISGNIKSGSKVLIERDVTSRLKALAPFLAFDHNPYVVLDGGRTKYVVDGYTTSRNFPNAERADTGGLDAASGLSGRSFNYARNSVKAVVDAYDGTVTLYVVDKVDPLIKAYQKAFPKLFTPVSEAPASMQAHFRYPEDLFTVQTQMWARYHVGDADTFYNGNDRWNIDQESGTVEIKPRTAGTGSTASKPVGPDGQALTSNDRFQPQYLLLRLPGEKSESFVIMRPFVPADTATSSGNQQQLLASFMTASSDPDDYGKLQTFVMPNGNPPDGPNLVAGAMESDPNVNRQRTLLCQQGSICTLGNVVTVPISDSLLYVRSLFIQGQASGAPTLQRVIVSYQKPGEGSQVAIDCSLRGALTGLFGDNLPSGIENVDVAQRQSDSCSSAGTDAGSTANPGGTDGNGTTTTTRPGTENPTGTVAQQENQLLAQIIKAFDDADTAARNGDQVAYAQNIQKANTAAKQLKTLREKNPSLGAGGSGGTSDGTTTTPPETTTTEPKVTTTTSAGA